MNVFFRELKSHRKSLFFWCLGMVFLVVSGMVKFANIQASGQSVAGLMAQFPRVIKIVFGLNDFDISKVSGYFGVLFLYIALAATVHAILLGTEIISKEERDKTVEFLFVKPISRSKVITAKLLAGLCGIVVLNIATTVSSVYSVSHYNTGDSITHSIMVLMAGLLFLQCMFFFIGMTIAAVGKNAKKSASIATSILLVTFMLPFFINFNQNLSPLKFLSPYEYFDAKTLLATENLSTGYITLSILLIGILATITYLAYRGRDLNV